MAVSEQDVFEEQQIQEDFKKAREIFTRIEKEFPSVPHIMAPHILFAMCLIYVRQLEHHKKEEEGLKPK